MAPITSRKEVIEKCSRNGKEIEASLFGVEKVNSPEVKLEEVKEAHKKEIVEPNLKMIKECSLEAVIEENREKVEQDKELRSLTENERRILKEKVGMTDANIEKCTVNKEGIFKLRCINDEYARHEHPETGIFYIEKVVEVDGVKIQVVVPEFPSTIDIMLPEELKMATESEQFNYLNEQLKEEIKYNPELKAQFTEQQIEMIEKGMKPKGFTWHHNEECCKMQLVRFETHNGTRHTGGNSIWSGGN